MINKPVIFQLADAPDYRFPAVDYAGPDGLLAVGGDLSGERLLQAYRHGIFPWYSTGQPILWWSPDPRALLFPGELRVSRSLKKTIRKGIYTVSLDQRFDEVIRECAKPRQRDHDPGTWITEEMQDAYIELHRLGYAHSAEVMQGEELVGGLYGIGLGKAFFGESMFSCKPDASKTGFRALVQQLRAWGYHFIDCQVESAHLASLGARPVPRAEFINLLNQALASGTDRKGRWSFEPRTLAP